MKNKKVDYKCPSCHAMFKQALLKCPDCGKPLPGAAMPKAKEAEKKSK